MYYFQRMGLNFTYSDLFVYVHVPFCVRKCFYCDFISTTNLSLIEDYFSALLKDLEDFKDFLESFTVRTVYFGGGTPSLVNEKFLEKVLEKLWRFKFNPVEITLEVNPESVTGEKLRHYREMGINRISLGVQAVDDRVLMLSGRPHGVSEIKRAAEYIAKMFDNFNMDFIVGLPGYSEQVVERNLKLIDEFSPSHVSVYTLELHENTPLYKMYLSGKIDLPENTLKLFFLMKDELEKRDFERYEISNFAKHQHYSVHNLSYWYSMNYLGVGVSAGGYLNRWRYVKTRDIREYIKNPKLLSYTRKNSECEHSKEALFMGLRLIGGVEGKIVQEIIPEEIYNLIHMENGRMVANDPDNPEIFERIANFNCSSLNN